jgi:hypothetical protein
VVNCQKPVAQLGSRTFHTLSHSFPLTNQQRELGPRRICSTYNWT